MDRREYVPTFTSFAHPLFARRPQAGGAPVERYVVGFRVKAREVVFITTEMEEISADGVVLYRLPSVEYWSITCIGKTPNTCQY